LEVVDEVAVGFLAELDGGKELLDERLLAFDALS
jgi:hypothetical protein